MKYTKYFLVFMFLASCKSLTIKKNIVKQLEKPFNNQHFSGLFVYDPIKKDTIINYNGNKYFTPASNTKIATLFTALQLLDNKIPTYKYQIQQDTILIQGTGNPTLLHPFFKDSVAVKNLRRFKHIKIITNNLKDAKYGAGWAWEDFDTYFSPERSAFPIYGNVITITNTDTLQVTPKVFYNAVHLQDKKQGRALMMNKFYHKKTQIKEAKIPFIIDETTTEKLWKDIFPNKKTSFIHNGIANFKQTAYSNIPIDSLYKRMMVISDNFLAEQILIMASSNLSDTLSSSTTRKYILKHHLSDLPHKPRWVDGSGLSRYNLFTPSSFVHILNKLYTTIDEKKLLNYFPVGGKSGTLKKWFKGTHRPYIFAKSGTLGNNYSLSGFLKTNSGKTLIFSFMNNHYKKKTRNIKKQMQLVFEYLRDTY